MKTLIEDYTRRLSTITSEIKGCGLGDEIKEARLVVKAGCYRTFIAELRNNISNNVK